MFTEYAFINIFVYWIDQQVVALQCGGGQVCTQKAIKKFNMYRIGHPVEVCVQNTSPEVRARSWYDMSLEENKKGHKSHLCTNKNEDVVLVENRPNMEKYMYKTTFKIFRTCRIGYQEEVCVQNRS